MLTYGPKGPNLQAIINLSCWILLPWQNNHAGVKQIAHLFSIPRSTDVYLWVGKKKSETKVAAPTLANHMETRVTHLLIPIALFGP